MSWETFDDETEGALRDAPPDVLSPINENAPVSGHQAPTSTEALQARAVEHDWEAAADHVYPVLRPAGTQGTKLAEIDSEQLAQEGLKKHALPLIDPGPADLAVAYVLREVAYDILVNADHLLAWGVNAAKLRETAMANLAAWSAHAPWTDELSGSRRLLSSDTGEGSAAARTLPMKVELRGAFRQVAREATVRAVILTGAGRAFCAGQDLRERLEPDAAPLGVEVRERYNPIIRAMRGLPKPIVGAINGVAA